MEKYAAFMERKIQHSKDIYFFPNRPLGLVQNPSKIL